MPCQLRDVNHLLPFQEIVLKLTALGIDGKFQMVNCVHWGLYRKRPWHTRNSPVIVNILRAHHWSSWGHYILLGSGFMVWYVGGCIHTEDFTWSSPNHPSVIRVTVFLFYLIFSSCSNIRGQSLCRSSSITHNILQIVMSLTYHMKYLHHFYHQPFQSVVTFCIRLLVKMLHSITWNLPHTGLSLTHHTY
jgi:hypothetical protein